MEAEKVIPLIRGNPEVLDNACREDLIDMYVHYRSMSNELLRRVIVEHNRIDILASVILGYDVVPHHLAMMRYQFMHPKTLQLAFRGAGKSTTCTIAKAIFYLVKDPNLRICLASKSTGNSQGFLKEIKGHFENNQRFEEVFGTYFDPHKVAKWDNSEIEILPRTRHSKEASITCVGVAGTIVSKHYDIIISDDLVDEENSRTRHMRDKTRTWFYKTLDPCLMPPDSNIPHRGEHHVLGTRYHYDDLYGHFIENELKNRHQIIPGLDENGNSPWPELYPPEFFHEKKENSGTIIFNAQYQCDTEAMKGEVFEFDDCQIINEDEIPPNLRIFMGTDLAVTEKNQNDQFASVVIGKDRNQNIYILDAVMAHLGWSAQLRAWFTMYDEWDPIRAGVETNAYQDVFRQAIKEADKDYRVVPIFTDKDKMTRAWKLQPIFEGKRVFFRRGMDKLRDQFVLFPNHKLKDGFDAFDLANRTSMKKRKRPRRRYEPGVI